MSIFEEDFASLAKNTQGFEDLPPKAKEGLRCLVFAAWTAGAKRCQTAYQQGTVTDLAVDMLEELKRQLEIEPPSHSKEKLQ